MARQISSVLLKIGGDRIDRRIGRAHIGLLQWPLRFERLDLCGSGSNARIDLRHRGPIVIIDNFSQNLVRTNTLKILHGQRPDVAGDFGRDGGQIRLKIGIVGGLPSRVALPTIPTGRDDDQHGQRDEKDQRAPDEIGPKACFEAIPRWRHDVPESAPVNATLYQCVPDGLGYKDSSRNLAIVAADNWDGLAPKRAVT